MFSTNNIMRIVGRDYIFKLMSPEFVESLFDVRRRYFLGGMPSEIGKNKTAFFVAKFQKSDDLFKQYTLVGEGKVKDVTRIIPLDKDYGFAVKNRWSYVIDFSSLNRYPKGILATEVLSVIILKKLKGQRPFGVELSSQDSKVAKEKLEAISLRERTRNPIAP